MYDDFSFGWYHYHSCLGSFYDLTLVTGVHLRGLGLDMELLGLSLLSDWRAFHQKESVISRGIAAARTCALIGCLCFPSIVSIFSPRHV